MVNCSLAAGKVAQPEQFTRRIGLHVDNLARNQLMHGFDVPRVSQKTYDSLLFTSSRESRDAMVSPR